MCSWDFFAIVIIIRLQFETHMFPWRRINTIFFYTRANSISTLNEKRSRKKLYEQKAKENEAQWKHTNTLAYTQTLRHSDSTTERKTNKEKKNIVGQQ